jgi:glycosyltransferase involved in cell wall biosynthesis
LLICISIFNSALINKKLTVLKLKKTKLFIVLNVEWAFLSHRLPIALEALRRGMDVTILAIEEEGRGDEIRSHGLKFLPLPTYRGSINIFSEFNLLVYLFRVYKKEKPDIIHHVTIKPMIYGSLAAKLCNHKNIVNAVAGLGSNFITRSKYSFTAHIVQFLFKLALNNQNIKIIVQNKDDKGYIESQTKINPEKIFTIKGSGVDLKYFSYSEEETKMPLTVILSSRMIKDKGIYEYVQAAKILKQQFAENIEFLLAGKIDLENVSSISQDQLEIWTNSGVVKWIGHQNNILSVLKKSNIVVLPSYREGLPKSLIEACAIGRAIITTDVPGCREVVEHGWNGFLVKVESAEELADAIKILVNDSVLRKSMGINSRIKAEKEFSIKNVIEKTFEIYNFPNNKG